MAWNNVLFAVLVLAATAGAWLVLRRLVRRLGVPAEQSDRSAAVLVSLQTAAVFVGFWAAALLVDSLLKAFYGHAYGETGAVYTLLAAFAAALLLPPLAGVFYLRRKVPGASILLCFQTASCLPLCWLAVLLISSVSFG